MEQELEKQKKIDKVREYYATLITAAQRVRDNGDMPDVKGGENECLLGHEVLRAHIATVCELYMETNVKKIEATNKRRQAQKKTKTGSSAL